MRFGLFGIKNLPSPVILETWAGIMQVLIIFCFWWHTWDMLLYSLSWVILNALTPFLKPESSFITAVYQDGWSGCQLHWIPGASATRSSKETIAVSLLTVTRCQNSGQTALSAYDSLFWAPPKSTAMCFQPGKLNEDVTFSACHLLLSIQLFRPNLNPVSYQEVPFMSYKEEKG